MKSSLKIDEIFSRLTEYGKDDDSIKDISIEKITSIVKKIPVLNTQNPPMIEWIENEHKLLIVEPTLLFYLRWRDPKNKPSNVSVGSHKIRRVLEKMEMRLKNKS